MLVVENGENGDRGEGRARRVSSATAHVGIVTDPLSRQERKKTRREREREREPRMRTMTFAAITTGYDMACVGLQKLMALVSCHLPQWGSGLLTDGEWCGGALHSLATARYVLNVFER